MSFCGVLDKNGVKGPVGVYHIRVMAVWSINGMRYCTRYEITVSISHFFFFK